MSEERRKPRTRAGEIAQQALSIVRALAPLQFHEKQAALACAAAMIQAQAQSEQSIRMRPPDEELGC